jgi:hypothetical protein
MKKTIMAMVLSMSMALAGAGGEYIDRFYSNLKSQISGAGMQVKITPIFRKTTSDGGTSQSVDLDKGVKLSMVADRRGLKTGILYLDSITDETTSRGVALAVLTIFAVAKSTSIEEEREDIRQSIFNDKVRGGGIVDFKFGGYIFESSIDPETGYSLMMVRLKK